MEYESRVRSWTTNSYQWMGMTRRRRWEIERDMSKIRTQPVDALLYPRALLECSHRWYIPIHIRHLSLILVATGLIQLSRPNWGLNGVGRSRTITEWRIFLDGSDDRGWWRYYRPMIIRLFRNLYAYVLLAESLVWFGLHWSALLRGFRSLASTCRVDSVLGFSWSGWQNTNQSNKTMNHRNVKANHKL